MGEILARPGQTLDCHHVNTAVRCGSYTGKFNCPTWGQMAGTSHDWGKSQPDWQRYLCQNGPQTPHSWEGAAELIHRYRGFGLWMAYAVAGHHTGLPDWLGKLDQWEKHLVPLRYEPPRDQLPPQDQLQETLTREIRPFLEHPESCHLWIRMLFSALVDADREDAAAAEDNLADCGYAAFDVLEERFQAYMKEKVAGAEDTPVNRRRNAIRITAEERAALPPGFFSLYVPTGAGKTLTAMAFALAHRRRHNLDRIIMAIPFCSIIEQTAGIYDRIFGDENVLEHHSAFDPESIRSREKQQQYARAAENWDMPIVVTTNVQLFESLFASRASAARKLHRIARSILILDEVQMLPRGYLHPVLSVLRALVRDFGCTVVLCSATLPPLDREWIDAPGSKRCPGLPPVTPLADHPEELAAAWSRVKLSRIGQKSDEELAALLAREPQVLCIVNTKKSCRRLYETLEHEHKIHLSAAMCPEERSIKIAEIRERLNKQLPVAVIATQVVEAGVDFDFPKVVREWAGWDSIAQAAGRCNREGKLASGGEVILFETEQPPPSGLIAQGAATSRQLPDDAQLTPSSFAQYFNHLYSGANLDEAEFTRLLLEGSSCGHFEFEHFAANFRWIENDWQSPVVVWYGNGFRLIEELRRNGPSRSLLRRMQRYTVNVPKRALAVELAAGTIDEVHGIYVQNAEHVYREGIGIQLDSDTFYCA